ncbi:MAG: Fic family protein, partial [Deltaproteobacteria bacterium]|nr:Fic family protein [Deltaproteobacteria bacterium]
MKKIPENYINQIQELLQVRGWTQEELAHELGVTFAALSRWLHGHSVPHRQRQEAIAGLHRQWVGLKPVDAKKYRAILKKSGRFKKKKLYSLLEKNEDLVLELMIGFSYHSNTMEGTTLTFRETEALVRDAIMAKARPFKDNLVISNHAAILRDILSGKYLLPLTEKIVKEIHFRLFQGVRNDAGEYSAHQRGITGLNIRLPHPDDVPEEMARFIKRAAQIPKGVLPIEKIASDHADFELIHPFGDGNGRVGRLMMAIQFLHHGYPPTIIENERKAEYYEVLEVAQRRNIQHLALFL